MMEKSKGEGKQEETLEIRGAPPLIESTARSTTEAVGFTSFLASACRVKAAEECIIYHSNIKNNSNNNTTNASNTASKDKEDEKITGDRDKSSKLLFTETEANEIMRWEYPIICHPSCLALLSSIMDSIATAQNEPSLREIKGFDTWNFILSAGSIKRIAMRTRFIDYYMLKTITSAVNPMQVVVLGAGMDTRAFRLPFSPSHYFEIDLPSVMDFKRSLFFLSSPLPPTLSLLAGDLSDSSWPSLLTSHGFSPSLPTLWVLEGLVMYLPESSVLSLLRSISSLSSPGSHMLLHTVNSKEVAGSDTNPSNFLSSVSSKMVFGVDDPSTLFDQVGNWRNIESYDYQRIEDLLGCKGYLADVTTNSLFTTSVFSGNT